MNYRELASQIHRVLLSLLSFHGPSAATLIPFDTLDGTSKSKERVGDEAVQTYPLRTRRVTPQLLLGGSTTPAQDLSTFLKTSPNLLVSTPGRLLEILSSPYVHCPQSSFEVLVLDEADRLLDLGFKDDLTRILKCLPKQRRTGLFSASVSEALDQIIRVGLRNPVRIAVKVKGSNGAVDKRTPASLQMTYLITPPAHKWPALTRLLNGVDPTPSKTIVYVSTCAAVDYFQFLLPTVLPSSTVLIPLHGKHPTNVRQKNFIRFTNSTVPALLLTTDVAARGLDIPAVDLVVQVDPPSDPKVFLHRCGRAGRAGRRGLSIIFLQPGREEDYISFLEVRETPVEKLLRPDITIFENEAADATAAFRRLILQDRALHNKAQKAFVSWVRSYSKHQASSIFRVSDLDWTQLAEAWGLLKMPKMPELKTWNRDNYRSQHVDWDTYEYKDQLRERQRRETLEAYKKGELSTPRRENKRKASGTSVAWSQNLEHKADKEARRARKQARREQDKKANMSQSEKDHAAETEMMVEALKQQYRSPLVSEVFEGFD